VKIVNWCGHKYGYRNYDWIKSDSDLDSVRSHPGYLELLSGR